MMRLIFFLLLLFAIDIYAFQAFKTVVYGWSKGPKLAIYITYALISVFTFFYIVGSLNGWFEGWYKNAHTYSRAFIFIFFFSKLFIALLIGIDDFRRLVLYILDQFGTSEPRDLSRSKFLSQLGIILGAIPFVSLTYGVIRNPYRYKLHRLKVPIKNLPAKLAGLRIVQISDIHSGSFTFKDPIKNGIDMINELDPDLVLFTGDLVNNTANEMDPYINIFSKIKSKYGVYSVLGNHDYGDYHRWESGSAKTRNFERLKEIHAELGWDLLLNEHRIIKIQDHNIAIIGVENYSAIPRFPKYGDIEKASQGTGNSELKILLSHDPSHWDDQITSRYKDIHLTFSGHTHGFQFGVEIPGIIKWSPSKYVYKQWAGLYSHSDQHLYVNRGFGFLGYPGRVGILPEVTMVELETLS